MRTSLIIAVLIAGLVATARLRAEETVSKRIARIQAMSPEEKEALAQKKKRFDDLAGDERERVKKLHGEIESRPDKTELVSVMQHYHEWLKSLTANQLKDLRNMPEDERVAHVKSLVAQQQKEQQQKTWRKLAEQASPEDLEVVFEWLKEFVEKHRDAMLRGLPGDFGKRLAAMSDKDRQTLILIHLMLSPQRFGPGTIRPGEKEVRELLTLLSPEARKFFEETTDFPRRLQLLSIWERAALWSKAFPNVTSEQLATFFDKLPAQERDRLEAMSTVERDAELRSMYARANFFRRGEVGERPPWEGRDDRGPRRGPQRKDSEPRDNAAPRERSEK